MNTCIMLMCHTPDSLLTSQTSTIKVTEEMRNVYIIQRERERKYIRFHLYKIARHHVTLKPIMKRVNRAGLILTALGSIILKMLQSGVI